MLNGLVAALFLQNELINTKAIVTAQTIDDLQKSWGRNLGSYRPQSIITFVIIYFSCCVLVFADDMASRSAFASLLKKKLVPDVPLYQEVLSPSFVHNVEISGELDGNTIVNS